MQWAVQRPLDSSAMANSLPKPKNRQHAVADQKTTVKDVWCAVSESPYETENYFVQAAVDISESVPFLQLQAAAQQVPCFLGLPCAESFGFT